MAETIRIDKWLWYARFFKSRTLASTFCTAGKVRINEQIVRKANQSLKSGDVLTFPQGHNIRVIKVLSPGVRRGSATEAQNLYENLDPPMPGKKRKDVEKLQVAVRESGSGRPTKSDRRATDRLRSRDSLPD